MFGGGYGGPGDRRPPEEPPYPHPQDHRAMMQGRYQDYRPPFQQFPPQYDSHYPPQGSPFWPHDAPPPRPDAPPPTFPSFYSPQHEYGRYPTGPPPHSDPYSPHYAHHSSSFGEHMHDSPRQQQGSPPPHIYSSEARHPSSEYVHVSSLREQSWRALEDHSSPYPHLTSSVKEDKPVNLQREVVLTDEISQPANVELPNAQLMRVFCKHDRKFNLAVKNNRLLMVDADTEDEFQQWIRDDRYGIRVRDNYGHPAFMLINKGSKKALKYGKGKLEEVQLVNYTPEILDDDLFWTESQDFGEGFKTIRMASDTLLNLSVACGNNIENGSALILDTWRKRDTQLWKIFPL